MGTTTRDAIDTAFDWHGGQGSALYSFASTGGTVWDKEHRARLYREIASAMIDTQDANETRKLVHLWVTISERPMVRNS